MFYSVSESKLDMARSWLEECRQQHRCGGDRVFRPKRLVFVGDDDSKPRLVEPGDESKRLEYAALSYCWGAKTGSFTTTFANLEANKQGVPLDELSGVCQSHPPPQSSNNDKSNREIQRLYKMLYTSAANLD